MFYAVPKVTPFPAHQRAKWKPAILPRSPNLGQNSPASSLLIPTAIAASIAFVGFRLGSRDHGIPSTLGYIVGGLGALAALLGGLSMIGLTVPRVTLAQANKHLLS